MGAGSRSGGGAEGSGKLRRVAERAGGVAFWLAVWLVAASMVDNSILLAGPGETLAALAACLVDAAFWAAVAHSGSLIVGVCLASAVMGCAVGMLAARFTVVERVAAPVIQVMKSAPVVCVVVILLVALGSQGAVCAIVAFVALPPFYVAALEANEGRPRDAERVLGLMGLSRMRVFLAVTWPAALPLYRAAAKTAVALSWRAGVTGELLGIPLGSIGSAVYVAKLTLDTPTLLAWTIVVMACGWACEHVAVALLDLTAKSPRLAVRMTRRGAVCAGAAGDVDADAGASARASQPQPPVLLRLEGVSKSFAGQRVLDAADLMLASGDRVCLMAPTGSGKTTLLRIALGLDGADAGEVERGGRCAIVLQQPALVESLSAWDNVALTAEGLGGARERADSPSALAEQMRAELAALLPLGALDRPACELSGGTRRLVEIARAVYAPGELLVLDEPFAGLDDATRTRACAFICRHLHEGEHHGRCRHLHEEGRHGRALVVATHNREDAALLGARVVSPNALL